MSKSSPYLSQSGYSPTDVGYSSYEEPRPQRPPVHSDKTVLEIASKFRNPANTFILQQRVYRPHTQSDRRRYVDEVDLEDPIMFFVSSDGCGINCKDAINSKFMNLMDRDDPMFSSRGPSVSIRLMWPGYAPWSRQIPTRDFRTPPGPVTRAKLAKSVAKTIQRFIEEMQDKEQEDDAPRHLKVGLHHITIDDIDILGLQHVSMGSWQAHLRIKQKAW
ncbi:hypothetical protein C8Q75DRAFT_719129 [Abortiporus biennis]|nr:hypothetical protein C8Q75DRAFT_719129 [Abortiporus biennis]